MLCNANRNKLFHQKFNLSCSLFLNVFVLYINGYDIQTAEITTTKCAAIYTPLFVKQALGQLPGRVSTRPVKYGIVSVFVNEMLRSLLSQYRTEQNNYLHFVVVWAI